MGARHSKRSMDVTTTPKKEGIAEGGEAPAVGDGKLERIEEADAKPTTNGVAPHTDAPEDKDNVNEKDLPEKETNKAENETKETEKSSSPAETPASAETPAEEEQVTTPTEETNTSITSASSPDTKEAKKKEKEKSQKKKWSLRSISFSKKDKNKPVREESPKNGDVSKEEPLAEGGEEAENAATSPAEEKSVASLNESAAGENEVKNEDKAATAAAASPEVASSPAEEKQEAPSSPTAPIPVPVEDKKEEKTENEVEKVEVSPTQAVAAPIEVMSQPQPIIAPSIIERKTSEDFPSLLPSSPPPTPINPSPLQQAQQSAAHAADLAEALKFPAAENLANACRLDYHRTDNEIINSESESQENDFKISSKVLENKQLNDDDDKKEEKEEIKQKEEKEEAQVVFKAIETQDVQSIVEDVPQENIDTDISTEEHTLIPDLSDSLKTCPIKVEEIAVENIAAVVDQQICSETSEKIDGDSKTEDNVTSGELIEAVENNEDNNIVNVDKIDIESKIITEDEEIPPPLPESPIPVPKASSQFMNFITSQIEDSPHLPESTDIETQPKSDVEELSLQSTDNFIPSPPTETVVDTSIDSENPLSLQEINNLPPPPPPEIVTCQQVPDLVSSNPQETVEDVLTLPRSPSPEQVSYGTIESSIKLIEPEVNDDKKIEAYIDQNNHEFIEETIAAPVEEINTKSDLENRQFDTMVEEKTTPVNSLITHQIQKNDQSIPETKAPVENSTLNSTTESTEEIPKSPLASVQTEIIAPIAPAITEDVTSVTKAVEEIDINEKAVAAAVNENIESANKNEIIADMNYQNINE